VEYALRGPVASRREELEEDKRHGEGEAPRTLMGIFGDQDIRTGDEICTFPGIKGR